ncbi:unnamed protein product, partial [Mesorhabditis belari]|uniref:Uncharacterized protein n=1 Tax=Mesorhabditis belari TaxID=2138241 RepID=A0AAF3EV39_9BILA
MRREEPRRLCGRFLTTKVNLMCKGCTKPVANSNGEVGTGFSGLADICCYKGKCTDSIVKQHCDDDCKNH